MQSPVIENQKSENRKAKPYFFDFRFSFFALSSPFDRPRAHKPEACLQACDLVEQSKADLSPNQTRGESIHYLDFQLFIQIVDFQMV